jgi:hypothetical protein
MGTLIMGSARFIRTGGRLAFPLPIDMLDFTPRIESKILQRNGDLFMSGMRRVDAPSPRILSGSFLPTGPVVDYSTLPPTDREFLLQLQAQGLQYFLDNQTENGLILDRQSNHGRCRPDGLCSLTATGMGFIALGLASMPPYRLLSPSVARQRIEKGLQTALNELPHDHGVMPHFVDSATKAVIGVDQRSTIESAWMVAGGLAAAAIFRDPALQDLADRLYQRLDFNYWTAPHRPGACGLLRHGMDRFGDFLGCCWDRLNGETVFMYVLAAGAEDSKALPPSFWSRLSPFYGEVAGLRFNNADLGLFVFQYGLDLLDARVWQGPGEVDLAQEAYWASLANERTCRAAADTYRTYQHLWGLSAGDGPGERGDIYRCYAPQARLDGTAHITATLASVAHYPGGVLNNLYQVEHDQGLRARGRYGFSNVNRDCNWVSRDMVGIDVGAAVLALDNVLAHNRVRELFHSLPCVQKGLDRLGFTRRLERSTTGNDEQWRQRLAG